MLNISLTINAAVIDVKLSRSEMKGEEEKKEKKRADNVGRRGRGIEIDGRHKATRRIWILLIRSLQ